MANSITLPVQYIQALDLIYKDGSLTSFLDSRPQNVQIIGKEMKIKKISTKGPADIARGGDFVTGDVVAAWETVTPDYDRARNFKVDALDEEEFGGLYVDVAADYEIQHSIPEIDAYRFAKYYQTTGIQKVATPTTPSDATALITAINAGQAALDGKAPTQGRILFVEASQLRAVQLLDTTKSRETLADFARIVPVPSDRFFTKLKFLTGGSGEEDGGYIRYGSDLDAWAAATAYVLNDIIVVNNRVYKCTTAGTSAATIPTFAATGTTADGAGALVWTYQHDAGRAVNFLIVHPLAIVQAIKRASSDVDAPNSKSRNWSVSNWKYGYCTLYENKANMCYVHYQA